MINLNYLHNFVINVIYILNFHYIQKLHRDGLMNIVRNRELSLTKISNKILENFFYINYMDILDLKVDSLVTVSATQLLESKSAV